MSDLGSALIRINVKVDGLGDARKKLTKFFGVIRKELGKVVSGAVVLQRKLDSLNASGLGKLTAAAKESSRRLGKVTTGLKNVEKGVRDVGKQRKRFGATFKGANAQIDKNIQNLKKVQAELDKINKKQKRNNKSAGTNAPAQKKRDLGQFAKAQQIREVGFALRDVGRQAVVFGLAVAGSFALIAREGAAFEQSVQNVVSVISGLADGSESSGAKIDILREKIISLGKSTEFTGVQIADAARQLALSGFSSKEIEDSLEAVIGLASATNTELTQTALIAARITRAFKLQASAFSDVADTLTAVATNSNTTLEGLGESFKLAAPIAAAYGQSLEDVAIAFGVLGDAGIQNSRAGTGISRFFSELTEKSGTLDKVLREVGSSFEAIDPTKNSLLDIIKELERLKNIGAIDASTIFDLFDQRSARTIVSAINSGSEAIENLQSKVDDAAGITQVIRDFRIDTLVGDTKLLTSAFSALAVEITQVFGPALRVIIQQITGAAKAIGAFVDENETLIFSMGAVLATLASASVILGTLAIAVGTLASIAGTIALVFAGLPVIISSLTAMGGIFAILTTAAGGFLAVLTGPIGITVAIVAIIALISGFNRLGESFDDITNENLDFINTMDKTKLSLEKVTNTVRDLNDQVALLRDLPNLNELQLDKLDDLSGAGGIFDVSEKIDEFKLLTREMAELNRKAQESAAKVSNNIFTLLFGKNPLNDDRATAFGEAALEISKKLQQVESSIFEVQRLEKAITEKGITQTLIDLEAAAAIQKVKQEAARSKIGKFQSTEQRADALRDDRNATDALEKLEERISVIKNLAKSFSAEQLELFESRLTGKNASEVLQELKDISAAKAEERNLIAGLVKSRKDISKVSGEIEDELLTGDDRIFARIESDFLGRLEAIDNLRKGLLASLRASEANINQTLKAQQVNEPKVLRGDDEAIEAKIRLAQELIDKTLVQSNLQEELDALEALRADNLLNKTKQTSEISEKSLVAQKKLVDSLALANAEVNGTLAERVELTKRLANARIKETLDSFTGGAQERLRLQQELNEARNIEIDKLLETKSLLETLSSIEERILGSKQTKLEQDIDKTNKKAEDDTEKLIALREKLKELLLVPEIAQDKTKKSQVQADLDRTNQAIKDVETTRNKANNKFRSDEAKKASDFIRSQRLNAAQRVDDLDEEFRLRKEIAVEKAKADVEDQLASSSAADRARALANELKRIDDDLAEARLKREEEIANKKKKVDSATKKVQNAAKKVNGFAKARADLESRIADKLLQQVQSLQQAKELIQFLNRLQSSAVTKAKRTGLNALAAQRKLASLKERRAEAIANKEPQSVVDNLNNRIARATLDLGIKTSVASNNMQRAGLAAGSLTDALNMLKSSIQALQGTLPAPGTVPGTVPTSSGVPQKLNYRPLNKLPKNPKTIPLNGSGIDASGITFNINGVTDPKEVGRVVRNELNDIFRSTT